jgi:hypothetical protein
MKSPIPYFNIGQLMAICGMSVLAALAPDVPTRQWMCSGWLVACVFIGFGAVFQIHVITKRRKSSVAAPSEPRPPQLTAHAPLSDGAATETGEF